MNLKLSKREIILLIILLGLLLLFPLVLKLVKQRQEIRKRAEGTGVVHLRLNPTLASKQRGEILTVEVRLLTSQAAQVNAANLKLLYDNNVFEIATPACGTSFPLVAGNSVDPATGSIYMGCSVSGGGQPVTISPGQPVVLGEFQTTVKDTAPFGGTQIRFAVTPQLPYVSDPQGNNLSDIGGPGVYTISAGVTPPLVPTLPPSERCLLSVGGGATYTVGSQIRVDVTQNPKHTGADTCFYGNMEVKIGGQTVCTATGFRDSARTQSCTWNTTGQAPGNYVLETTYGGHADNCPAGPCCDEAQNCQANVTLTGEVTPIPTITPTVTPTVTPPPGQVKIQFKVKFFGIDEERADQAVRVMIKNVRDETKNKDLGSVTLTADENGVYQSELITLPSNVTSSLWYHFLIKGPKQLMVRYCANVGQSRPCNPGGSGSIYLVDGENQLDFTRYPLLGGDLPLQDGVVNSLDAVALTNCFATPDSEACLNKADLNLDGIISTIDMGVMNNTIYSRWEDDWND